jgi:hypothetical protein
VPHQGGNFLARQNAVAVRHQAFQNIIGPGVQMDGFAMREQGAAACLHPEAAEGDIA